MTRSQARAGQFTTPHGTIPTPAFMPVGTQATVKALDPDDLRAIGAPIVLANTYHLSLRPGAAIIERAGGLHRFMAWDRPILTDSGGFQVFSLGDRRTVDDDGVTFRSHLDGSLQRFTPESVIALEESLGADIIMPLDECVALPSDDATTRRALDRTHRWLERALAGEAARRSGALRDRAGRASIPHCGGKGPRSPPHWMCRASRLVASVSAKARTEMYASARAIDDRGVADRSPALSDGRGIAGRSVGSAWRAASISSIASCRRASRGTAGCTPPTGRVSIGNARFRDQFAPDRSMRAAARPAAASPPRICIISIARKNCSGIVSRRFTTSGSSCGRWKRFARRSSTARSPTAHVHLRTTYRTGEPRSRAGCARAVRREPRAARAGLTAHAALRTMAIAVYIRTTGA